MNSTAELANALRRIAKVSYGATVAEGREVSRTQRDAATLLEQQAKQIDEQQILIARLKSMTDAQENLIREHIAAQRKAQAGQLFAGLVLKQHRNDGYPGDLDGDFLQGAAVQAGLLEERIVAEPCSETCTCAEAVMPAEFPVICYFNTEAGKAAIAAAITAEDAREGACNT